MGFGMIVRNSAGDFIAAKALTLPGLFEIKEGEAFGFFFFLLCSGYKNKVLNMFL